MWMRGNNKTFGHSCSVSSCFIFPLVQLIWSKDGQMYLYHSQCQHW